MRSLAFLAGFVLFSIIVLWTTSASITGLNTLAVFNGGTHTAIVILAAGGILGITLLNLARNQ